MVGSSCFKIGDERLTNVICYAKFLLSNRKDNYVFVPNDIYREVMTKEELKSYLDDLKDMGFQFKYRFLKKELRIFLNVETSRFNKVAFLMALRFPWEHNYIHKDKFHFIYDSYIKLKSMNLPYNKLELMCIAHNFAPILCEDWWLINSNHCWSGKYVKVVGKLPTKINNVNSFFVAYLIPDKECETLSKIKEITTENVKLIYEILHNV